MAQNDDWRLTNQGKYLLGATLQFRRYVAPSSTWDHDHCEFCWRKFTERTLADTLQEGYATTDTRHWICSICFADFKDRFNWALAE